MKHKMKLAAAVVAGLGAMSAQAGVITATAVKTYAVEVFGAATTAVTLPIVSYQIAQPITGTATNPNTFFVDVTLSNGATWSDMSGAALTAATAPTLILSNNTPAKDLAGSLVTVPSLTTVTLRYSFTVNSGAVYPAGITTFALGIPTGTGASPAVAGVAAYSSNVNTILGTDGGACVAAANNSLNMVIKMFDSSGTNQVDTVGTYVESAIVARSVRGITGAMKSSSAFTTAPLPESAKIDVINAASVGKQFTSTGLAGTSKVNLGSVTFTDGNASNLSGAPYNLAGLAPVNNGTVITINGDMSAAAGAPANGVGLYTDAACTTPATGSVNGVINAAKNSATISMTSAFLPTTGTPYYACLTIVPPPATAAVLIQPSQYSGYATLNKTAASAQLVESASAASCIPNLYLTAYNGAVITVRNYNPRTTAVYGWNQLTRIINTGRLPSTLSAFYVNADGTTSTSAPLVSTAIPAGGSVTLSNTAVEAAIGAPLASANVGSNARLRIVSNTDSMRVQNYHIQPNGSFFETSGAQDEGNYTGVSTQ